MKKLALILAASAVFAISGCSSTGDGSGDSAGGANAGAEKMISDAGASIKKAGSAGGAWRDSSKTLKKAKAALAKGDTATAEKLAKRAKFEGEMGYQQAQEQKSAGPWLF